MNVRDSDRIIERLRQQVTLDKIRVSLHGHEEMVEDDVSYDQLCEALSAGKVIENYPEYQPWSLLPCLWTNDIRKIFTYRVYNITRSRNNYYDV